MGVEIQKTEFFCLKGEQLAYNEQYACNVWKEAREKYRLGKTLDCNKIEIWKLWLDMVARFFPLDPEAKPKCTDKSSCRNQFLASAAAAETWEY